MVSQRPLGGPLEPNYRPRDWTDHTITWRYRKVHRLLGRAESFFRQAKCGLHSNIPPCCVLWFLLFYKDRVWSILGTAYRETALAHRVEGRNYVPCPKCLITGHKRALLYCGCTRMKHPYPPLPTHYIGI